MRIDNLLQNFTNLLNLSKEKKILLNLQKEFSFFIFGNNYEINILSHLKYICFDRDNYFLFSPEALNFLSLKFRFRTLFEKQKSFAKYMEKNSLSIKLQVYIYTEIQRLILNILCRTIIVRYDAKYIQNIFL